MSAADAHPQIAHLCDRFLHEDLDAQGWAFLYPDESAWESPDCDEMSRRFLQLARAEGLDGYLIRAESLDEGSHWFTVLALSGSADATDMVAVDWTARQFYNADHPRVPADPGSIPCPLVFDWPGPYPLDRVSFHSETIAH